MPRTKQTQATSYKNLDGEQVELKDEHTVVLKVTHRGLEPVSEPYIIHLNPQIAKDGIKRGYIGGEILYKPDHIEIEEYQKPE